MSAEGASIAQSQLDLYDFFSVLLPGVYLLTTLIPFLPQSLPLGTVASAVVLLVGGYVVGRAIHNASRAYDQRKNIPSNRDTFINTIKSDDISILTPEYKNQFYTTARQNTGVQCFPPNRTDASDDDLSALYVHVRSRLYQHGNVRSQSFQAIYAFYRSAHFATLIAAICYGAYGVGQIFGTWSGFGSYSTYIGSLGLEPGTLVLGAELFFVSSLFTLANAKTDYRDYFIEYLIADYLSISPK